LSFHKIRTGILPDTKQEYWQLHYDIRIQQ